MNSKVLQEDLKILVESEFNWNDLKNTTFLITGATGLIGSLFAKMLLEANRTYNLNIKIIAMIRNYEKAQYVFEGYTESPALVFVKCDICYAIDLKEEPDYILHTASVTNSQIMVNDPVETINVAIRGSDNVFSLAQKKHVKKVIYLSSMEVYGSIEKENVKENDLGYIDLKNVRSCYPEAKRMCECLANAYYNQYNLPICIARLAQTFGPGISKTENRVFAQFARSVVKNQNIVLHTTGASEGNYCYTRDVISALVIIFEKGKIGETYNICNEQCHTTIGEMARMVVEKIANKSIRVVYEIPNNQKKYGYAPDVKLKMSADKLRALGWEPQVGLEEAYTRLIKELGEKYGT